MGKTVLFLLVILACVLIVISFFMPWAKVSVSAMGVSKELTDIADKNLKGAPLAGKVVNKLKEITGAISDFGDIDLKTEVRGVDIPRLVNNRTSKVALSVSQMLFKSAENLDKKSYAVYFLPLFGVISALLAIIGLQNRIYVFIMTAISGIIAFLGLYNINTVDLSTLAVKITIADGLRYTMYGFSFIFFVGIVWLVTIRKT